MARNGSGTYVRVSGTPYVYNTVISETTVNSEMDDVATALTNSIAKDGQTTPTANLPMGTYRHTGVGNGSARTDYAAMGQVQDGKLNWVDGGGTADAITATYVPPITALVDGQLCFVRATAANATTTPTFSPNGLTARTIVKKGGAALVAGDIVADGHELILRYDVTNTRWELLNPGSYAGLGANTFTGLQTWKASADIASAATVDLTAATGNITRITGTVATSAFTMNAGQWHMCIADGAWPLTYNATTNKLNTGGGNFTCAAGDRVLLHKDNSSIIQTTVIPTNAALVAASQAEMEAGIESALRSVSPLRVAQAIAALSGVTLGTPVTASGVSVDFTSIPSWVKQIIVSFEGISTNGTSIPQIQLGDSGGVETSGYVTSGASYAATIGTSFATSGFILNNSWGAALVLHGSVIFTLLDASTNTWVAQGILTGTSTSMLTTGSKSLSAILDRVRITTVGGTDTFDAGKINIAYK